MAQEKLLFGTAGVPASASKRTSVAGIERIRELGLDCMELEFVQSVRMRENGAKKVLEAAGKEGVALSVHAPYYINLNSLEEDKLKASIERIYQAARIGSLCGAESIVFHAAFYQKSSKEEAYAKVSKTLRELGERLRSEGIPAVLRPETMGKSSQFGTLEEVLSLSREIEGVRPCLDFSHMHAREGKDNSYPEFAGILERVEETLGKEGLYDMHMHVSGIDYGKSGEKKHLLLEESDFNYPELLKALKEFGVKGLLICESPNLEGDALLLKKSYEGL
ncbi:MAG: TIM barrel protein [Methanosarcinaceae archaeon]|nr:TIM barrel protein [Methanosarcinaceae archaeon]